MKKLVKRVGIIGFVILIAVLTPAVCYAANNISIDGYPDDWANIPQTAIYYNSNNEKQWNYAAVVAEEGYINCYVSFANFLSNSVPVIQYWISVNGNPIVLNLNYSDSNGNIDYSMSKKLNNLSNGVNGGISVFAGYYPIYNVGDAAIYISNKGGTFLEFRVSIAMIEQLCGLPENTIENGATIEFYSPILGDQTVVVVGTSTGTFVGIGICVVVAIAIGLRHKKKVKVIL
ncbi:Firmicu-CTERM sorting domain-containing protein [Anaerosporobacter sp.]|uniref:Firmicu-CTERM sorting domain-containing protein n=1 Tax=Anaerosporobacter sp. TaxID=1872529 RepID=UPI00286F26B1|nr:Firmicu-CTERM sorting domain-containing protein [Anaerosporobacter sp.]